MHSDCFQQKKVSRVIHVIPWRDELKAESAAVAVPADRRGLWCGAWDGVQFRALVNPDTASRVTRISLYQPPSSALSPPYPTCTLLHRAVHCPQVID